MKKLLKVIGVLIALVVILLLVATVALKVLLPPEKAKALIIQKLSAQLHREVEIGSVSVSVLSGLRMTNLKISENPTFAKGTFVSSEEFAVNIALFPLLSKQVVIRRVQLKKPEVTIIRKADGLTFNFSDLTETAQPVPAQGAASDKLAASEGPSLTLLVGRADVQQGGLKFIDQSPAKQSVDIRPFDLTLENVSLTKPFVAKLSTKVKYQGHEIGILFGGDANLFSGVFNITQGEITTGQVKLSAHGALTGLKTNAPAFKLHVDSNAMPVKDLLAFAPPNAVPPGVTLDGKTTLAVDLSGAASQQQFATKWSGTDLHIAQGQDFDKAVGVPLELSVIGDRSAAGLVGLKTISGNLAGNLLSGSGIYDASAKAPVVHLRMKGTNWSLEDLSKLLPALAAAKPKGNVSFDAMTSGPASAPQTKVATQANFSVPAIKHEYYLGQALAMKWDLTDITPDLSKINGTASFTQGPGQILQLEKLASSSKIGRVALAPVQILAKLQSKGALSQINLPSLQKLTFDALDGDYALKGGLVDVKKFNLAGKDLSILNSGKVGLTGAQSLLMNVSLKLAKDSVGGTVGSLLKDESGRPTVKMLITGTAEDPKMKLDLQEAQQKAIKQVGDELMKNKDIKDAVDQFKGIFK